MTLDLSDYAAENGVKYFMISYTDLFGGQRAKLVPAQAIAEMQTGRRRLCGLRHLARFDAGASRPFRASRCRVRRPSSVETEVAWVAADCFMEEKAVEQAPRDRAEEARRGRRPTRFKGQDGRRAGILSRRP